MAQRSPFIKLFVRVDTQDHLTSGSFLQRTMATNMSFRSQGAKMTNEEAYRKGIADALTGVRGQIEWLRANGCLTQRTDDRMVRAMVFANAEARDMHFYPVPTEVTA
jgi:hypothetical protein